MNSLGRRFQRRKQLLYFVPGLRMLRTGGQPASKVLAFVSAGIIGAQPKKPGAGFGKQAVNVGC
jgi:hypothetical protein